MNKPTSYQMRLASEWLDANEGNTNDNNEESESCYIVAAWLRDQALKIEISEAVNEISNKSGKSKNESRKILKKILKRK